MQLRIVMPTLGRSPWWSEALDSTRLPGFSDRVVVCPSGVELGSPDWRRLEDEGRGLYSALNAGFAAGDDWDVGTYLNDDDRLLGSGVARALKLLASDQRIGAVFGRVHLIDGQGRRLTEIPVAHAGTDIGPLLAGGIIPLAQPGTLFRRELFTSLEGFDSQWRAAGDMDFFMRALRAGWSFGFVDAVVAEFRVHPAQISQQAAMVELERDRLFRIAGQESDWKERAFGARFRFRRQNLGVYFDRLRRHGFASMQSMYGKGARA